MNVRTALIAAKKKNKSISRIFLDNTSGYVLKVTPSHTKDGLLYLAMIDMSRPPVIGWQPSYEDLVAEDWVLID
ncbi:Thoeris anti-defense Tad2 family protein [Erysipelothrix aquatica]|uniref:Thoeris anti-defense Tad2 family protein n=1 Tax=Erysipelothrix aquatica TaxID=2683714 RepID=UPI0013584704|nr:MW1434 family type I TA system toxin [Erysipelothrix aquatica]